MLDFEAQLAAKGGEKDQRAAIRQLIAQAGGEEVRLSLEEGERSATSGLAVGRRAAPPLPAPSTSPFASQVRKVLELVSRVPPTGAQQQQKQQQHKAGARQDPTVADADALLQGAIYNAVFTDD